MTSELLSEATKWYLTKVADGVHLSNDSEGSWDARQRLHASMWRKYFDRIGVLHVKNNKDFTIEFDGGCFRYAPKIIVQALDISFVDYSRFDEYSRQSKKPGHLIPLHINFDCDSVLLDLDHIFSETVGGFALVYFPTLPCSNFDQYKKQHPLSEGKVTQCAFQKIRFRSEFLSNERYTEGKYAKSFYYDRPVYFSGTSIAHELSLHDFTADIFGRLFLVSESELYSKHESNDAKFRLDPCIEIANEIVIDCYERYKAVYWMQGEPEGC